MEKDGRLALSEFLATFLLVFAGCGAMVVNALTDGGLQTLGVGLSFGLAVAAAVWIFGPVSGAHINPAITIMLASTGRCAWSLTPVYLLAQLTGAVAAAGLLRLIFGNVAHLGSTVPGGSVWQSLALEAVISFFLALVVLSAVSAARPKPWLAALSIGAYVGLAATFAGPISGASMNPARSFGPALISGTWEAHWLYWLSPVTAALLAGRLHDWLRPRTSVAMADVALPRGAR